MNAFRSALLYVWLSLTMTLWSIAALIASLFVRGTPLYRFCAMWMNVALPSVRAIIGIRTRVTGQENVPDGAAVFLVKHQSALETLVLPGLVKQPLSFVFKREILYIPFFGWAFGRLDMIHIDRGRRTAAYARVLRQGQLYLKQGNGVVMFPEGTRMPRGQTGTYQSGGARLAIGAGVPVVPVAVASARCWTRGFVKHPGVLDISFGPPIDSAGMRPDELMNLAAQWIEAEMRRIDPLAYPQSNPQSPEQTPPTPEQGAGESLTKAVVENYSQTVEHSLVHAAAGSWEHLGHSQEQTQGQIHEQAQGQTHQQIQDQTQEQTHYQTQDYAHYETQNDFPDELHDDTQDDMSDGLHDGNHS